jgi:peptidoglycan/LPS O-acetylase OafA/YrhL
MRAIAVLMVVVSHTLQLFLGLRSFFYPLGNAGVLIFFIHTALVLLMSIERSGKEGATLFKDFYLRRLFRIYPLSILVVLILATTNIPDRAWGTYSWIGWKAVGNDLLLISNITKTNDITTPLWSLPYEVQMYLALPAIYLLIQHSSTFFRMMLWMAAVAVATLTMGIAHNPVASYAPCFVAGTLAFHEKDGRRRLPALLWPAFVIAWIMAFSMVAPPGGATEDIAGWIACPLLAVAIPSFRQATNPLVCSAAKFFARFSYGIYLTHMPLLWICFVKVEASLSVRWLLFVALGTAIPMLLYKIVESPMIRRGRMLANSLTRQPTFAALAKSATD